MKYIKYALCGIAIGLVNGVFASGGGVLAVLFLEKLCKLEKKKAHASAILVILPISIMSIFFYTKSGHADFSLVIKASLGGILGGFAGAKL